MHSLTTTIVVVVVVVLNSSIHVLENVLLQLMNHTFIEINGLDELVTINVEFNLFCFENNVTGHK
ncbi:hypothetical protein D3C80_2185990 [compost metagenome]